MRAECQAEYEQERAKIYRAHDGELKRKGAEFNKGVLIRIREEEKKFDEKNQ